MLAALLLRAWPLTLSPGLRLRPELSCYYGRGLFTLGNARILRYHGQDLLPQVMSGPPPRMGSVPKIISGDLPWQQTLKHVHKELQLPFISFLSLSLTYVCNSYTADVSAQVYKIASYLSANSKRVRNSSRSKSSLVEVPALMCRRRIRRNPRNSIALNILVSKSFFRLFLFVISLTGLCQHIWSERSTAETGQAVCQNSRS